MQSVLNSAARLVFSASRYDRITPLLTQLHWLKVLERIEFKLAVLVYKCLHQTAPPYLAEQLHQSSADEARQRLHCASIPSLVVRRTRLSTIGDRCCPTVEHSATERHVGVVNICFQETFEDPSLQSFFPRISCNACAVILDTFFTLLYLHACVSKLRCLFHCYIVSSYLETLAWRHWLL